jgi:N-acetylmuramoyl-L-alanine amidase CwlA
MSLVEELGKLSNNLSDFTQKTGIPIHNQLIANKHPNRLGRVLTKFQAIGIHYTANENPGSTDIANAKYFGRTYLGEVRMSAEDPYEKVLEADGKSKFRLGSTQLLFDTDSGSLALPLNEVSWAAGDRPLKYDSYYKGQRPVAHHVFANSQNYRTLNIEICNNDIIKQSDEDWNASVNNAKKFLKWLLSSLAPFGVKVNVNGSLNPQNLTEPLPEGELLILRHYDMTGKMCPKPFIDNQAAWTEFVVEVSS